MNIRRATTKDIADISALMTRSAKEFIINEFSAEGRKVFLNLIRKNVIRDYMETGFVYHVAEIDDRIVGVIGMKNNNHLYHLFVDSLYHGRGIACTLWQYVMKKIVEKQDVKEFIVNSSNYAIGMYEAFGFVQTEPMQEKNGVLYNPMVLRVE